MSADPFVIFGVLLAVLAVVFIIVLVRSSTGPNSGGPIQGGL